MDDKWIKKKNKERFRLKIVTEGYFSLTKRHGPFHRWKNLFQFMERSKSLAVPFRS